MISGLERLKAYWIGRIGQRVSLRLSVARSSVEADRGRRLIYGFGDVQYATFVDESGVRFHGRVPANCFSLTCQPVSATVSHVDSVGEVHLKNIRVKKS